MAGLMMMLRPVPFEERSDFQAIVASIIAANKRNIECRHCRIVRFREKLTNQSWEAWAFQ